MVLNKPSAAKKASSVTYRSRENGLRIMLRLVKLSIPGVPRFSKTRDLVRLNAFSISDGGFNRQWMGSESYASSDAACTRRAASEDGPFAGSDPYLNGLAHKRFVAMALLLVSYLITACAQTSVAVQPPVTISIAGSTAFLPVLSDLTEEFSLRHPNVVFDLRGGGSVLGVEQLHQGKIDIATTTQLAPPPESFVEQTADTVLAATPDGTVQTAEPPISTEIVRIPIGLDAIAIVVHATNKLDDLSLMELQDIYSGRIVDWSEVGEESGEILLISREESSGTRQLFEDRIMGDEQVSLTAVVMPTNIDVLRYIASHPTAIGYLSRSYVVSTWSPNSADSPATATPLPLSSESRTQNSYLAAVGSELTKVKTVHLDGQAPTIDAILTQQYYLIYPLFLLTRGEPQGWSALFIEFVLSPAGQAIVRRYHAPVR